MVFSALDNYSNRWWPRYFVRKPNGTYLPISTFNVTTDGNGNAQWFVTTRAGDTLSGAEIAGIVAAGDLP